MKPGKVILSTVYLLLIAINSYSQELNTVLTALKRKEVGKTIKRTHAHGTSEATYLGVIVNNNKTKYHVVKEFYKVKAALVYHGHSRILFFDLKKKLAAEVIVNMPSELPYKVKNNSLYFKYIQKNITKTFTSKIDLLPKMICVDPHSCYEVLNR